MDSILPVVLVELVGDVNLQQFALHGDQVALAIGLGSYGVMIGFWVEALRKRPLAWGNSAWDGWSSLATALYCYFVLKEDMTPAQWAGCALISGGIFLLGDGEKM
jgi:multidrug transporter EmrE-like cation transporter